MESAEIGSILGPSVGAMLLTPGVPTRHVFWAAAVPPLVAAAAAFAARGKAREVKIPLVQIARQNQFQGHFVRRRRHADADAWLHIPVLHFEADHPINHVVLIVRRNKVT